MTRSTTTRRVSFTIAAAIAISLWTAPAFAADRGLVPGDPRLGSIRLGGLSESAVRTVISAVTEVPPLASLPVRADGTTYTLNPSGIVRVDVEAMLTRAFEPTAAAEYQLAPAYSVDRTRITAWVRTVASRVARKAVNSSYAVNRRRHRLVVSAAKFGRRANQSAAVARISAALVAEAAAGGARQPAVILPVSSVAPKITKRNIGKAIMVVLSRRRVYLYSNGRRTVTYRCAVGQRAYATPTGSFRVIRKVRMPSWNNPGSAWAKSMPSHIGPGPSNPLGTRALYLSAPGIRIHGTINAGSIGTAASHGCMRMLRRDIERLYPQVPVGTPVFIIP